MNPALALAIVVAALLVLERALTVAVTSRPAARQWIVRHRFCHPNAISWARTPMGAASVLLWEWWGPEPALLWFAFWMITDLTDGTIARRCGLITETGKWLDPLSDKLMYLPLLAYFAWGPATRFPLPGAALLLFAAFDIGGQAARLFVLHRAANRFGKTKTAFVTLLLWVIALDCLSPFGWLNASAVNVATWLATALAALSFLTKVLSPQGYNRVRREAVWLGPLIGLATILGGQPVVALLFVFLAECLSWFHPDSSPGRAQPRFRRLAGEAGCVLTAGIACGGALDGGLWGWVCGALLALAWGGARWTQSDRDRTGSVWIRWGAALLLGLSVSGVVTWVLVPVAALGVAVAVASPPAWHPVPSLFRPKTLPEAVAVTLLLGGISMLCLAPAYPPAAILLGTLVALAQLARLAAAVCTPRNR